MKNEAEQEKSDGVFGGESPANRVVELKAALKEQADECEREVGLARQGFLEAKDRAEAAEARATAAESLCNSYRGIAEQQSDLLGQERARATALLEALTKIATGIQAIDLRDANEMQEVARAAINAGAASGRRLDGSCSLGISAPRPRRPATRPPDRGWMMARKTPCQTDGAIYGILISSNKITVTVECPFIVESSKGLLEANIHNVMELALAPLFQRAEIDRLTRTEGRNEK